MLFRSGRDELIRRWAPLTRVVVMGSNLIVVTTVWLFLPYAPTQLRIVMAAFYVGQIATQIVYSPENATQIRIGMVAIFGSASFVLLQRGTGVEIIVAIFMIAFGTAMFVIADAQLGYIRQAIRSRFQSEDAQAETERAMAAVAAARDAKTRFIAAASHDLGQPLQAAALFFDQVVRAPDDRARAVAADGVRRAFNAADQLLSHMLNHLRLESDAVEPHPSKIALGASLRRSVAQFEPAANGAEITLRFVMTRRVVLVDPALFERAVGNLIGNAISHSGGTRILVGTRRHVDALRIWVIDDGAGVNRADAPHIFDAYYRGSTTTTATQSGFGLGLATVRRIAGLLGGHAGLDGRWVRGSAFYIELPHIGGGRYGLSQRRVERTAENGYADLSDC